MNANVDIFWNKNRNVFSNTRVTISFKVEDIFVSLNLEAKLLDFICQFIWSAKVSVAILTKSMQCAYFSVANANFSMLK